MILVGDRGVVKKISEMGRVFCTGGWCEREMLQGSF